jgi:hypothetical protein
MSPEKAMDPAPRVALNRDKYFHLSQGGHKPLLKIFIDC